MSVDMWPFAVWLLFALFMAGPRGTCAFLAAVALTTFIVFVVALPEPLAMLEELARRAPYCSEAP